MYCNNCKREVKSGQFCPKCGNLLVDPDQWYQEENYGFETNKKPEKKNSSGMIAIIAVIGILLVVAIALAVMFFAKPTEEKTESGQPGSGPVVEGGEDGDGEGSDGEDGSGEEESSVKVEVPDVVGLPLEDASTMINDQKLSCNIEYRESEEVSEGYVISQYPAAGKEVAEKETVLIYVAKGGKVAETPTPAPVTDTPTPAPVTTQPAAPAPAAENTLYCCASDYVTLRASASRSSASLTKIPTRGAMTFIGEVGEFYNVSYNGQNGYVLKEFVSFDPNAPLNYGSGSSGSSSASASSDGHALYCCASDYATLRSSTSRESADLGHVQCREAVEWLGDSGEWYYVRRNGQTGYVLKAYFSGDPNAPLNYGDN